jgi:hypothetical protein
MQRRWLVVLGEQVIFFLLLYLQTVSFSYGEHCLLGFNTRTQLPFTLLVEDVTIPTIINVSTVTAYERRLVAFTGKGDLHKTMQWISAVIRSQAH